jgi:hypothetical protein
MSEINPTAPKQSVFIGWLGALLVRLFIPAWILFGAYSKLQGATPKSLPRSILDAGGIIGFQDHFLLLSILVAIEFVFIGFMLFSQKLARIAAISILSIFLVVLGIEMFVYGNYESCGCFGEKSLAPTTMFAIDFALLLGIVIFKPRKCTCALNKGKRSAILITIFVIATWTYTFSSIMSKKPTNIGNGNNGQTALPSSWYPQNIGSWIGQSVDDINLFSWVKEWPHNIHDGKQYVIFYSLTCDHCEALFYAYFEFPTTPTTPTTLVAIPESTDGFNVDGAFDNPCHDCAKTELAIGPDWIIGTPMVVAIENGIVKCVIENEDYEAPTCLIW